MLKQLLAFAALAALVAAPAVRADEEDEKPTKDVVATAVGSGKFKTLVKALTAADLVDTLKGPGPFTVFAPTDEAFKRLGEDKLKAVTADKELLTKVLLAHVVKDKAVMAKDVLKLDGETVNGFSVKVKGDKVTLSNAKSKAQVVKADIKCKNGVIHVIDAVLVPDAKAKPGKGAE